MKRGKKPLGYTIIEVMIFLLVTGALLASALLVFRGRQERTRFTQSVQETEAQLRTIMNGVESGYYPSGTSFSCTAPSGTAGPPAISGSAGAGQGTNQGCIFIGKTIAFTIGGDYNVYTTVGRRQNPAPSSREVGSFLEAYPTLVAAKEGDPAGTPDITERFKIPNSLNVKRIVSNNSGSLENVGAIGFMTTFGTYGTGGSSSDLISGSQQFDIVPISGYVLGSSVNVTSLSSQVRSLEEADRRPDSVIICLEQGSGGRRAALVLGGNGAQNAVQSIVDDQLTECN